MAQACRPSKLATGLMLRISALLLTGLHLHVVYVASVAAWPVRLPGRTIQFVFCTVGWSLRAQDIAEHQTHLDTGLTCPTMPESWSAPVKTSSVMCESTLRSKSVHLHGHEESTRRQCLYLRLSRAPSTTATTRRASTLFMLYALKYQWPNELPTVLTIVRQSRHATCAALLQCPGRQS